MNIAIVGSGYVGLVAAACFAELGHQVVCVDRDEQRIAALNEGQLPIHEKFLPELLKKHAGQRLLFSPSLPEAVRSACVVFIAVGTPANGSGQADLSAVEAVARELASCMGGYKVIAEKSTVPVCTSERIRQVMMWNHASAQCFDVVSNPEFLREGTAVTDFLYPDRIVIGADSPRASSLLCQLYKPLLDGSYARRRNAVPAPDGYTGVSRLIETSAKSAELIKHASNSYLAMKISFINAVASICEAVGADVEEVCRGLGSDSRIGQKFLRPGIGYGGSCFPKDLTAFRAVAQECGVDFRLLSEVIRINEEQRSRFVSKVRKTLWVLRGKKLAVLGLSFKGGTDDIRESPALRIVEDLIDEGSRVVAYDPAAMPRAREAVQSIALSFADDPYAAAKSADALLILSDWDEFAELDLPRVRKLLRYPVIVDGRNLYSPEQVAKQGFHYVSVGREDAVPASFASLAAASMLKAG